MFFRVAPLDGQGTIQMVVKRASWYLYRNALKHARLVALVLNPRTGLVSPQWHIWFDVKFLVAGQSSVGELNDPHHHQQLLPAL
jgi:hypothetical protein